MRKYLLPFLCFMLLIAVHAQPKQQLIDVSVVPVNADWLYGLGERADFEITVTKNGQILKDVQLHYQIGLEGMQPSIMENTTLFGKPLIVKGIALKDPGFVRCSVKLSYEGQEYSGIGAAGFEPHKIIPTVKEPMDFDDFWNRAKEELAKIPLEAKMTLQEDLSTDAYQVFHVELSNIVISAWHGESHFYGMLSVPRAKGRFPAILSVPGAGVRPYFGDNRARDSVIVFKVGIHGIPVNMEHKVYDELVRGALAQYSRINMYDKDKYYYKRVYMGCLRAVDFIYSLPQFDGGNLVVNGGSQGGALSIIIAALDSRIKGLAAFYPALSDMTGYLYGRVGGWPHQFRNIDPSIRPLWENTAGYYDVVNFAKRLKVPGWYSWGYNDNVCPPTTTFSVYNSITAPKELHVFEETGHWTYPEQLKMANAWMMDRLKGK